MLSRAVFVATLLCAAMASPTFHPGTKVLSVAPRMPMELRRRLAKRSFAPPPPTDLAVSPADFGGDPTGRQDSTTAVQAAVQHCINATTFNPTRTLPYFGADGGGCTVDLKGGEFLISASINIPFNTSNLRVSQGSLVASPSFPPSDFMIVVGTGYCHNPQGSCIEDIGLNGLFLDGGRVAAGCIQTVAVMGTVIGPQNYLLNFTSTGIDIVGGHEVMIVETWLGERNFDATFTDADPPKATGIAMNSNDHYIQDSIVFAAKVGLSVAGAADMVSGLHVWFPKNAALHWNATAFDVSGYGNRFEGCYVDGSVLVVHDSAKSFVWVDGFMLGGEGVQLVGTNFERIQIMQNEFQGGTVKVVSPGANLTDVRISDNLFENNGVASRATLTQTVETDSPTRVSFDFSAVLIHDVVSAVASFTVDANFPGILTVPYVLTPVNGTTVNVELHTAFQGTVTVTVDASAKSPQCHYC